MNTLVYSYGSKPPSLRYKEVCGQIRLAHCYQNDLVAIELERREKTSIHQNSLMDPKLLERKSELEENIEQANQAFLRERSKTKSRKRMDKQTAALVKSWKAQLESVNVEIGECKKEIWAAEGPPPPKKKFKSEKKVWGNGPLACIDKAAAVKATAARNEYSSGKKGDKLYFGSYLLAEKAHHRACHPPETATYQGPPRFHSFDGSGQIGVQLQGKAKGHSRAGIPVSKLSEMNDTRLQVLDMDHSPWQPKGPKELRGIARGAIRTRDGPRVGKFMGQMIDRPGPNLEKWRLLRIRIGSNGQKPIWAEFPFKLHRPLPADGIITWATVQRRRCGPSFTWHVQFTVSVPSVAVIHPNSTVAGIDVGWRKVSDALVADGLRSAVLSAGEGHKEEVVIGEEILKQLEHPEEIRSGRDKDFNRIRANLQEWMKKTDQPDWFREETEHLGKWKSMRKLARLVAKWKDKRINGDSIIFAELEAWRKQDRHLWDMESHLRQRGRYARRHMYRNWALKVCKQYGVLVIEKMGLDKLAKLPNPEDEDEALPLRTRRARVFACVSELRLCLKHAASKTGTEIRKASPRDTTQQCHICGFLDREGPLSNITGKPMGKLRSKVNVIPIQVTCSRCLETVDQDFRAAMNLLAKAEEVPKTLAALARE